MPLARNKVKQVRRTRNKVGAVRKAAIGGKLVGPPRPFSEMIDIELPEVRPLKAYAFDPSLGHFLGNEMTLAVKLSSEIYCARCLRRLIEHPLDPVVVVAGVLDRSAPHAPGRWEPLAYDNRSRAKLRRIVFASNSLPRRLND